MGKWKWKRAQAGRAAACGANRRRGGWQSVSTFLNTSQLSPKDRAGKTDKNRENRAMLTNAHEVYFLDRVMGADRLELVRMLYSGAIEAVRVAREELAAGRIGERSKAIGKAYRILAELTTSLDRTRGG